MDKFAIEGLTDEQNTRLNYIYRKLKRDSEQAQAKVAEFSKKLTEGLHPLDTLGWAEPVFEAAAIVEVYRPFINNIEGALVDLDDAAEENKPAITERFVKFVDGFEDDIKTRVATMMNGKAYSTMQTRNIADHYKTVAMASLTDLYY